MQLQLEHAARYVTDLMQSCGFYQLDASSPSSCTKSLKIGLDANRSTTKRTKSFTTVRNSILELVELQSLMAKML